MSKTPGIIQKYLPVGASRGNSKTRSRAWIIACNLNKLPKGMGVNLLKMQERMEAEFPNPDWWVMRLHDDTAHKHFIISLYTKNAHTKSAIAKRTGLPEVVILPFKGSKGNLFSYPIHHTSDGRLLKRVYKADSVITNIPDYVGYIRKVEAAVKRHKTPAQEKINEMAAGKITPVQLANSIGIDAYLKYSNRIKYAVKDAQDYWHKRYITDFEGQKIQVYIVTDLISVYNDLAVDSFDRLHYKYERAKKVEGMLTAKHIQKAHRLARALAQSQGKYHWFTPMQDYGWGYEGEPVALVDYDEFLLDTKNKRSKGMRCILESVLTEPKYHDLSVWGDKARVPMNLKTLVLYSDSYIPDEIDPLHVPDNVHIIGLNSQYDYYIKALNL